MARIVKRRAVLSDMEEIQVYLGRNSLKAADRFSIAAENAFAELAAMPELGGRCESDQPALAGLRVWPIPGFGKYLIFYRTLSDGIEIRRVLHGARDIEGLFGMQQ
jgi:toxin ParE1/3/4